MLVASNFPQYDKVITTDVDVVFLGDIAPSYFVFDENSSEYLAGIKPVGKILWYYDAAYKNWSKEEVDKMTFCGGYLVINTKKIREDNLEQKFIDFFQENLSRLNQAEQDILNLVCYPNIKYLPLNNLVCS
jgi:lipopolysaccharide biosynthesis glycosyltransferase